ncbi:MAG TPA: hypothetical protein PKW21_02500 [Rhabdaerophilum sp.]|nr:hypothetical protein [Rhabdaerophilum sp.]
MRAFVIDQSTSRRTIVGVLLVTALAGCATPADIVIGGSPNARRTRVGGEYWNLRTQQRLGDDNRYWEYVIETDSGRIIERGRYETVSRFGRVRGSGPRYREFLAAEKGRAPRAEPGLIQERTNEGGGD